MKIKPYGINRAPWLQIPLGNYGRLKGASSLDSLAPAFNTATIDAGVVAGVPVRLNTSL